MGWRGGGGSDTHSDNNGAGAKRWKSAGAEAHGGAAKEAAPTLEELEEHRAARWRSRMQRAYEHKDKQVLRIPASSVAAVCGLNPWADHDQLFMVPPNFITPDTHTHTHNTHTHTHTQRDRERERERERDREREREREREK